MWTEVRQCEEGYESAAVGSESARDQQKIQEAASIAGAVITGPVSPSKLWKVVTTYLLYVFPFKTHNAVGGEFLQKQKNYDGLASLSLSSMVLRA